MHRCQYNKTWLIQARHPAGNLNWHNVKTMPLSHNNTNYITNCLEDYLATMEQINERIVFLYFHRCSLICVVLRENYTIYRVCLDLGKLILVKFSYDGLVLGSSQFLLLSQLPQER